MNRFWSAVERWLATPVCRQSASRAGNEGCEPVSRRTSSNLALLAAAMAVTTATLTSAQLNRLEKALKNND